ncbi:hypothetical protein HY642_03765 [Candidatus Woesearchaeota archaeon]|nr:hypothetical protein [Candidatus Woesearchaeota archaeon]
MRKAFHCIVFLLFLSLAGCEDASNGAGKEESNAEWERLRAEDIPVLSSEWSKPVPLGVNAYDGWLDSVHVADDGKTIYYVFYPGNDLITDSSTGHLKGDADIYMSDAPFETHGQVNKYFMNEVPWSACCVQLDADGNFWYNSNREGRAGGSAEGNYDYHPVFRNDELLAFNDKKLKFEDVFYCKAKDELWLVGDGELYTLAGAAANGFRGKPVNAPAPITEGGQPFLTQDCNTLYFTTNRGDVDSEGPAIYRSQRSGDAWSDPVPVAWSRTGVGEYTLTADGKKAFLVQLLRNEKGAFRIRVLSAEKKG